jgi:hypothetical protein
MHLARVLSAILSTICVWAVYRSARLVIPNRRSFAVGATAAVAFVPGILFINGAVNNDNLAATLSALALLVSVRMVRDGASVRRALTLGVLLGLALLSKVGTLAVWPGAALALASAVVLSPERHLPVEGGRAVAVRPGGLVLRWLGWSALSFGTAVALAAAWLARNWRLYGDPLGWALVRSTVDVRTTPLGWSDLWALIRGWFTTYWGRFGGAVHIFLPGPLYAVLGAITVASAFGLLLGLLRVWRRGKRIDCREGLATAMILALLSLTLVTAAFSVVRYSLIGLGTDQARLLFPALSPIGVLFFLGLAQWLPARRLKRLAVGLTLASFAFSVLVLFFLRAVYAPPLPADEVALARANRTSATVFDERLALVGHEMAEAVAAPGETLRFSLYWRAEAAMEEDLRSEVWVLAPDGGLVASWKRSPLGGRFSTDRWPVGPVYADDYALPLPDWLSPGEYTLAVGVREFPSESWLRVEGGQDSPQHAIATMRVQD